MIRPMQTAIASLGAASPYARASAAGLGPFAARAVVRVTPGEAISSAGPLQPLDPAAAVDRGSAEPRSENEGERASAAETILPTSEAPAAAVARSLVDGLEPEEEADLPVDAAGETEAGDAAATAGGDEARAAGDLTEEEERVVDELRARDREVRAHEEAHKRVGGQYAGAITYEYQEGPDGKSYAIGGSVPLDVAPIPGDPEATIQKMQVVIRAALAPAEPSSADRAIAQNAKATMAAAQAEAREARQAAFLGGDTGETASFAETRLAAAGAEDPSAPEPGLAPRLFDYGAPTSTFDLAA